MVDVPPGVNRPTPRGHRHSRPQFGRSDGEHPGRELRLSLELEVEVRPLSEHASTSPGEASLVTITDDIEVLPAPHHPDDWTDLDSRAVDTVRVLAADAVQKVGNGHPGTALRRAP